MGEETSQNTQPVWAPANISEDTLSSTSTLPPAQPPNFGPQAEREDHDAEKPANKTPGPPPNGGFQAWLQVVGGFMLFFNTWGIFNCYGVFQTYYESGAIFTKSSSDISWIGAVQAYLLLTVGFLSGPIYDRGYFRALVLVGSFLIVFGHMMLSLCHTYWEVLLAQGFAIGIGAGCLFVPCVALLPTYFTTRLGLAVGIAVSGSSFGGVIYPIVLYRLIGQIGFGWSVRVVGFMALGTLLVPIAFMKMRFKPPKPRRLIDWSAFMDASYMVFVTATLIGFIALFISISYISFYAADRKITDTRMAFYIVPIFNAASCFGRTVPNAFSDKTGPLNLIAPGALIVGILNFCTIAVTSEAALIVVAALTGFFTGVFIALPPVCFVALTPDRTKIGTRMGMGFGMIAFGMLAGGPGGGRILGTVTPLNWHGLWIFGGVAGVLPGLMYAGLRVARHGSKLKVKA